MNGKNIMVEVWNLAITLLKFISKVFDWLFEPLELSIQIPIQIPVILEDGINLSWNLGITPISLLGVGIVGLVVYWVVLK